MRTIPDDVGTFDLTIPFSRDLFTINPTGMPNGDPSLQITDPASSGWYAYYDGVDTDDAPIPYWTLKTQADLLTWSINFWIKADLHVDSGRYWIRFGNQSRDTSLNQLIFGAYTAGSNALGHTIATRNTSSFVGQNRTSGDWDMWTCVFDGPANSRLVYRNATPLQNSTIIAGSYSSFSLPRFSIGADNVALTDPYSATSAAGPGSIEIGKIAIWKNGLLTQAQITSLYEVMYL